LSAVRGSDEKQIALSFFCYSRLNKKIHRCHPRGTAKPYRIPAFPPSPRTGA